MKLLFDIPRYLPGKDGAIMMVRDYKEAMEARGHEVKIMCYDGRQDGGPELYDWADIVLSHLGRSTHAKNQAEAKGLPFIWLKHSDQNTIDAPTVYNSHWLRGGKKGEVCYPICDYSGFEDSEPTGDYITLIGMNPNKGGLLLKELAKRMPGHRFIAVSGAYGGQEVHNLPRNIKLVEHPCLIGNVLTDTKILLVMSEYESFSRCTAEALSMGIPVISTETKGVKECGEQAPYYIEDRESIEDWKYAITEVWEDLKYWQVKARSRGKELRALSEEHINNFENFCYENQGTKTISTT